MKAFSLRLSDENVNIDETSLINIYVFLSVGHFHLFSFEGIYGDRAFKIQRVRDKKKRIERNWQIKRTSVFKDFQHIK